MAQAKKSSGRSNYNNSRKSAGNSQRKTTSGRKYSSSTQKRSSAPMDSAIRNEIILIGLLAVAVVLFLCNFGVIGVAGDQISHVMFGIFGLLAYIVPIAFFVMIAFGMVNSGNSIATRKLMAVYSICLRDALLWQRVIRSEKSIRDAARTKTVEVSLQEPWPI